MLEAVIYDMDGLIIDSEPHWRAAEVDVFGRYGVPLTWTMCKETMGLRVDEVVEYWAERYPIEEGQKLLIRDEIMERVSAIVQEAGELLPGVQGSIDYFKSKNITLALASSSEMRLIDTVLDTFRLRDNFTFVYSAEAEPYGKPHPGVYLTTAQRLGAIPARCLAIEDSINGILAAKAAKMRCIAVPDKDHWEDKRLGIADSVVPSLADIDDTVWKQVDQ